MKDMKKDFAKNVHLSNWEEAVEKYPDFAIEKIFAEKLSGKNLYKLFAKRL